MGDSLFPGLFYRREIVSADRFRSPVAGDQRNKIRPQPMCGPYGWGKFDDRKYVGAALAGVQPKIFRNDIDPADLDVDPSDQHTITFIGDGQNSLSAVFNFRSIVDLSEIQYVRLGFEPRLRDMDRFQ